MSWPLSSQILGRSPDPETAPNDETGRFRTSSSRHEGFFEPLQVNNTSVEKIRKLCPGPLTPDSWEVPRPRNGSKWRKRSPKHPKRIQNGQNHPFASSIFHCASFWLVSFLDFRTHQSPIISLRRPMISLILL